MSYSILSIFIFIPEDKLTVITSLNEEVHIISISLAYW